MYKVTEKDQPPVSLRILLAGMGLTILIMSASTSALSAALNSTSASSTPASAKPTNANAEITVKADYMAFDLETGKNIYQGNVSIKQGSIELTGDKVTILRSNDKVSDIDVTGNPARYLQDENTDNIVRAMSQKIHYSAQQSRLTLSDNASLEQSDHTVESQRIVYDTAKKIIIAGKAPVNNAVGNSDPEQRVNITLTPKKNPVIKPGKKNNQKEINEPGAPARQTPQ